MESSGLLHSTGSTPQSSMEDQTDVNAGSSIKDRAIRTQQQALASFDKHAKRLAARRANQHHELVESDEDGSDQQRHASSVGDHDGSALSSTKESSKLKEGDKKVNGTATSSVSLPSESGASSTSSSTRTRTTGSNSRGRRSRRKKTAKQIGIAATVIHLLKGNVGPGAMSLPNGFSQSGVVGASIMFVTLALLSIYNMNLLLYVKRKVKPEGRMSFGDVGKAVLGKKGKLLIDIFLVGTQLGICCVYFTFIATNIHVVLPESMSEALQERQIIFLIFPFILVLSWIRTLAKITPFSNIGNLSVVIAIGIVFYCSFDFAANDKTAHRKPTLVDWDLLPGFFGTAVYSFEGIGLILPIQNEMKNPELFPRVLWCVMLFILVIYLCIGLIPTISFGVIDNGSVTAVLFQYADGMLVTVANLLMAFACLLSFPTQFYPAIEVLERAMAHKSAFAPPSQRRRRREHHSEALEAGVDVQGRHQDNEPSGVVDVDAHQKQQKMEEEGAMPACVEQHVCTISKYECNRTLFRSMLCTSLMVIAVCVPDVGLLISLFGAIGSSMLAIVIPPLLYVSLDKHSPSIISIVFHCTLITVGACGMILGGWQSIIKIINSFQE